MTVVDKTSTPEHVIHVNVEDAPEWKAKMVDIQKLAEIQLDDGNWNYDPYMRGMANGMILILATLTGRDPVFKDNPEEYIASLAKFDWTSVSDSLEARYDGETVDFRIHGLEDPAFYISQEVTLNIVKLLTGAKYR